MCGCYHELFDEMTTESQIREACRLVWRNLPQSASTFGECPRCHNALGRGSGPCLKCAEKELAALTGENMASVYVRACRTVRDLEEQMVERLQ